MKSPEQLYLKPHQNLFLMKMQSSVLSQTEVSPMESKSSKITELQQKESVATWTWKHPNIQPSFFESLPAPIDIDDAHLRMCCHKNTEIDFDLQIKTMELEEKEYSNAKNEGRPVDDLITDALANQIRYVKSKRYHHNAHSCYWYWIQEESNFNQKKAKCKKKLQK